VVLDGPGQRRGPGGQHQGLRPVLGQQRAGRDRVGGVRGHRGEAAPICSRTLARAAASRATPITEAPSFASAAAMARPKPRLAPVTRAVLPDICRSVMTSPVLDELLRSRRGPAGAGPVTQADTGRTGNSSPPAAMTFGAGRDLYR
jgi:hypothetical protein